LSCCFHVSAPAPSATYPLSLHDALPIWIGRLVQRIKDQVEPPSGTLGQRLAYGGGQVVDDRGKGCRGRSRDLGGDVEGGFALGVDRKSTRLNSSHVKISYAVFCLKKKTK